MNSQPSRRLEDANIIHKTLYPMMKFSFFFAIFYGLFRTIFLCIELPLKGIAKLFVFLEQSVSGKDSPKDLA